MKLKDFFVKNRETIQLIYGIILIILIPSLIAFNTIFITKKYNESLDVALQRQALIIGRSIYNLIKDDLANKEKIQNEIEILSRKNLELQELAVLEPEGDVFKITASSKKEDLGKILKFYYYAAAWMQPDNDGLATDSLRLSSTAEGEQIVKEFLEEDRFWLVAMPMTNAAGEKQALLTIKISSKIIDDLTNYNRNASIYLLIITVLIVILFLAAAVRLWDYVILYKKIKEVDQMKDEFVSIASHELRTPITAIKGYISLILDGTLGKIENEKVNDGLGKVAKSAERLGALVEDLLNVSRIEQGRLEIEMNKVDIIPIVKEIVEQLKVSTEEKGLALEYLEPPAKQPFIWADSERLKQIMINLIGNAIKYTEKGEVKISTKISKDKMEIKVGDTGVGMSAEEQKRLFEKFYRVKNEKTGQIVGTGLGLWITKQLVELMKGKISVESMKDIGTQVTVTLNLAKD